MCWVDSCLRNALRFDKNRPTGFETTQRIVQTAGYCDKFGWPRRYRDQAPGTLLSVETTLLVEDDALVDKSRPSRKIRETRIRARYSLGSS